MDQQEKRIINTLLNWLEEQVTFGYCRKCDCFVCTALRLGIQIAKKQI